MRWSELVRASGASAKAAGTRLVINSCRVFPNAAPAWSARRGRASSTRAGAQAARKDSACRAPRAAPLGRAGLACPLAQDGGPFTDLRVRSWDLPTVKHENGALALANGLLGHAPDQDALQAGEAMAAAHNQVCFFHSRRPWRLSCRSRRRRLRVRARRACVWSHRAERLTALMQDLHGQCSLFPHSPALAATLQHAGRDAAVRTFKPRGQTNAQENPWIRPGWTARGVELDRTCPDQSRWKHRAGCRRAGPSGSSSASQGPGRGRSLCRRGPERGPHRKAQSGRRGDGSSPRPWTAGR